MTVSARRLTPDMEEGKMKMNKILPILLGCLLSLGLTTTPVCAEKDNSVAKVVFHADYADPVRFSSMLTSIFNMVTTYENQFMDYDIRIVFLSHGIRFLTNDRLKGTPFEVDDQFHEQRKALITRLKTLHEMQNINLSLCNITREAINLDKDKLIPGVTLVTSGVVEIAKLQGQGFAYLKVQ
jgi:intracellular sulfur oxidation DsrE/DsrF family protein